MDEINLNEQINLANSGDVVALYYLSYYYYNLNDLVQSFKYCEKASLLENKEVQCTLGWYYECGIGTNIDLEKAFYYYELAAKQGYAAAFDRLGTCYMFNRNKQDFNKAYECYKEASIQKYIPAILNLGTLYATGRGVEKDLVKAYECYKETALDEYSPAYPYLYNCYIKGEGVNLDIDKAIHYLKLSSLANDEFSAKILGDYYHYAIHVEKNIQEAIKYYNISVEQNYDNAMYELGLLYKEEGNNKEALINFEKATNHSHICSLWELAVHYEVHQKTKSLKYYKKIFKILSKDNGVVFTTDEKNIDDAIKKYKEVTKKYYEEELTKMKKFRGLC